MKPPMTRAGAARSAMKPQRPVARLPQLPTPNPPAAPKVAAPLNNRPMGVSPAPMPNPMPMSPAEQRGRMQAAATRGTMPPQRVMRPAVEAQPGFRSGPTPTAMAEGGKVRKPAKKSSKVRRK